MWRGALALMVLAVAARAETAADRYHPARGLNLDIWNTWITTEQIVTRPGFLDMFPDWRGHVLPAALAALAAQGFDFARVPIDPAPLLRIGPGARQDGLIDQIAQTVLLLQAADLKVIIDLHAFPRPDEAWGTDSILADPALFAAYVTLTGRIAARLNGMDPDRTAFEPMNEPTLDCDAVWGDATPRWPVLLHRLHAAARTAAPDLPLVLTGACWGGPEGLAALDPAALQDDNVIWSFHSYTPFLFTHQGAGWTGGIESVLHHVPYPPTRLDGPTARSLAHDAAERARQRHVVTAPPAIFSNILMALGGYRDGTEGDVTQAAQIAAAWADSHHIPHSRLLLGEFGAIHTPGNNRPADRTSRLAFLRDKRLSAETLGIGWAVWSWSGDFGVAADGPGRKPDPAVCTALGLLC